MLANYTFFALHRRPRNDRAFRPDLHRSIRSPFRSRKLHGYRHSSETSTFPPFSNRRIIRHGPLQWIAGDWQLAPIVGLHSGSYFEVTTGLDNALTGIGAQNVPTSAAKCVLRGQGTINLLDERGGVCLSREWYAPETWVSTTWKARLLRRRCGLDAPVPGQGKAILRNPRRGTFNIQNRANFLNPGAVSIAGGHRQFHA